MGSLKYMWSKYAPSVLYRHQKYPQVVDGHQVFWGSLNYMRSSNAHQVYAPFISNPSKVPNTGRLPYYQHGGTSAFKARAQYTLNLFAPARAIPHLVGASA